MVKIALPVAGHVAGSVALENDPLDRRLEEVLERLGVDGGEESEKNNVTAEVLLDVEPGRGCGLPDGLVVQI